MSVREGAWLSKNDKDFILRALRSGRRVDGRRLGDMRLLRMVFSRAEGKASAEVQLGRTRVLAVLTSEVCDQECILYGMLITTTILFHW